MLGCQDNPLWLVLFLAEISLQDVSCVVIWSPAFHSLQQDHYLQVLSLLRYHMDFFALSHDTTSWAEASAGCKLEEQRIIESFR